MVSLKLQPVKYIVLHHTATHPDTSVSAIKKGAMHWLDQNERLMYFGSGYVCDYHWLVDQDGLTYKGQPESMVSFHSGNNDINNQSIAVCAIGDFQSSGMNVKQFTGILQTLMILKKRYPKAIIIRHRDIVSTECPGAQYPYEKLVKFMTIQDLNPASWDFKYMVAMLFHGQYAIAPKIYPDQPLTRAEYAVLKSKENKWV